MNEPFVPMQPAAKSSPSRSDFRVAIVSGAENLRPFQPLGQAGHPGEPRVTLQRDGGRVSAIRVQCSCGQVIEIECVYEKAKG